MICMVQGVLQTVNSIQMLSRSTGYEIESLDRVGQFISTMMDKNIEQTLDFLYEITRFKHWERQIKLVEKVETLMFEKGISQPIRPIKSKMAFPIFKSASLEDQEELHDIWARLFTSALDSNRPLPRYVFIDIIRQLEIIDLNTLNACYECLLFKKEEARLNEKKRIMTMLQPDKEMAGSSRSNRAKAAAKMFMAADTRISEESPLGYPFRLENVFKIENIGKNIYQSSIDNLVRQNLVIQHFEPGNHEKPSGAEIHTDRSMAQNRLSICLTALGVFFVETCLP